MASKKYENEKSFVSSALYEKIYLFFKVEPYILLLKPKQKYLPESSDKLNEINSKLDKIYNTLNNN